MFLGGEGTERGDVAIVNSLQVTLVEFGNRRQIDRCRVRSGLRGGTTRQAGTQPHCYEQQVYFHHFKSGCVATSYHGTVVPSYCRKWPLSSIVIFAMVLIMFSTVNGILIMPSY